MEMARRELRSFIRQSWHVVEPGAPYVGGPHIDAVADHLTFVSLGDIDDLVINVPPRHSKSTVCAVMWPAWEWAWNPSVQWLFTTYAQDLTLRDSVKCRRLILSPWYQARWGNVFRLSGDLNQKKRFDNDKNGYRLATSVGGTATGEGGDRIVVDDAHNMKEINSDTIRGGVIDWWRNVMSTRGNNPRKLGRVIIAQRGHHQDLPGWALDTGNWVHLNLPGYYRKATHCRTVSKKDGPARDLAKQPPAHIPRFREPLEKGELIWEDWRTKEDQLLAPQRFSREVMRKLAGELTERAFEAQIQQNPSAEAGNILKKAHWREWAEPELPSCQMIIQSYDTAFEEEEENDYSARTTWGVFEWREAPNKDLPWQLRSSEPRLCMILLERLKERLDFPKLRAEAMASFKLWKPDRILIEKKASGHSLAQELRRAGLPVTRIKVADSKHARAHAAALVLERGCIWYVRRAWAQEVIDNCAAFPSGEDDDVHDTVVQAALWLRARWNTEFTDDAADIDLMRSISTKPIYG
jgi:predicted phage terminase large subunit-like protein